MQGLGAKLRVAIIVVIAIWIGLLGLYGLLKPISNGCIMTYMYPTYIPISTSDGVSLFKYGLYLYHEGWKKIDFNEHVKQLSGIPVLFIPGNGGSYKQVRSLAAESDRAYQSGPLVKTFFQEASLSVEEGGAGANVASFQLPNQYVSRLDWFAVDLEGEHSAMDGQILEEHTEYVVYAIHKILDQYKESHEQRKREGAATSGALPKSVILVGHSMGGFVARAAIVHPRLRKLAVETVLTLSTPHQSPPVALQPSLAHYFARVNKEWRKGFEVPTTRTGHYVSDPLLSHVVVVSISGGYNDYQVRSKLESVSDIVPPSNGFLISSTAMRNVWLSMEHQAILWCNQLVVQVSHTLLTLVDPRTGHPFPNPQKRLAVFSMMLRSGLPQRFNWMNQSSYVELSTEFPTKNVKETSVSQDDIPSRCPSNIRWSDEGLERDLYIRTTTVTVLAMDGRRRWLDIQKLGANRKSHFMFVTNLIPCFGVRLHLWPERGGSTSDMAASKRILEVTTKLVQIPSRSAPRQVEPGSQTEQAPPSAVLLLSPEDMHGFRFLSISVAPRPTVSGRPPPAVSMAVGQFFNPEDGETNLSAPLLLLSTYSPKEILLKEDHPLAISLSFGVSLGLLPVSLSLETTGCGIKRSGLPDEEAGDMASNSLCKLRCFPPVAVALDPTLGLHFFPNLYSDTIVVDSSPGLLSSTMGSEKSNVLLMVDPHCSYKMGITVFEAAAACRFLLLYSPQIVGLSMSVIFFALMRQVHAWNLDLPLPSMLTAVESNLRMPLPFLLLCFVPNLLALIISFLKSQSIPPFSSFITVSMICNLFANGIMILLILISQWFFYMAAFIHVFFKTRWQGQDRNFCFAFVRWFIDLSSILCSLKVVKILRAHPLLVTALTAINLGCFVHPALGLIILLMSHALCCHGALCSFLNARKRDLFDHNDEGNEVFKKYALKNERQNFLLEDNSTSSPDSSKCFSDTQLEIFYHQHGLLLLHLLATLMFMPSLVAWLQRLVMGHRFPWFLDSSLCIGVILHGIFSLKPEFNSLFSLPGMMGREVRLDLVYMLAGCYSYLSGLDLAPYRVFYAMTAIGFIFFSSRTLQWWSRDKGEPRQGRKKHSHRH